ncbi:MAG: hypothetical protein ACI9Y1_000688 [Lentisphaeria bacterium]|jgi:hypothetical protein
MDYCYCASVDYLAEFDHPTTPADLQNYRCLRAPEQTHWAFNSGGIDIHGWLTLNDKHPG